MLVLAGCKSGLEWVVPETRLDRGYARRHWRRREFAIREIRSLRVERGFNREIGDQSSDRHYDRRPEETVKLRGSLFWPVHSRSSFHASENDIASQRVRRIPFSQFEDTPTCDSKQGRANDTDDDGSYVDPSPVPAKPCLAPPVFLPSTLSRSATR